MAAPTRTPSSAPTAAPPPAPPRTAVPAPAATTPELLEQARAALGARDGQDPRRQAAALHTWWQDHRRSAEGAGTPVLPFATLVLVAAPEVFELAFQAHFDAATGRTTSR